MLKPPRMKIQRMQEAWKTPLSTGIFTQLQSLDVPWQDDNISTLLNMQYHINRSGKKIVAPLIESYTNNTAELNTSQKAEVANVAFTIYGDKWSKLYTLMQLEYNPISNYDMTETEEIEGTRSEDTTRTGSDTTTGTGTDTFTHTGTEAVAHTGTIGVSGTESNDASSGGSASSKVYGFNSSTGVNDGSTENETQVNSSITRSETTTHNDTDTKTNNLTDTETRNTTDTVTHNTTDSMDGESATSRTLTRSGNIGVTTSQQMIQSSIELYQWNFFEQVFKDLDTILTISTY